MASASIARADPLGGVRALARLVTLLLLLFPCLLLHLVWRLVRRPSPWPRRFLGAVARICGARVEANGARVETDVFYVANHLSWIDICILGGASGAAFVAHDGVARAPIVGWLARLNNTVFVARADRLNVGAQVAAIRAALDARQPIAIFPEGTTTDGNGLLPFKPALFAVMAPPPRPMRIQPVLLDFGPDSAAVAWVGDEPGLDNARRLLARPGGFVVTVRWLEPFDPAAIGDRKAIAHEARERIRAALSASQRGPASL
ncbi:lysophospholipid acyltransferase family protein [Sphingomonas flavalba]|uniref:lysophospholipid acyltransferase family protein n=1 Tax=Sphingomonas flavalba TaxID=2559804 RepID=UPI0039E02D56